jgi:hypothetical protein
MDQRKRIICIEVSKKAASENNNSRCGELVYIPSTLSTAAIIINPFARRKASIITTTNYYYYFSLTRAPNELARARCFVVYCNGTPTVNTKGDYRFTRGMRRP